MSPPTSLLLPLLLLLSSSSPVAAADPSSIPHLFDPLIPTKLNATYLKQPSPPSKFPQYTTRNGSEWLFFSLPTWTSGFFPASLYALHERATLCPSLSIDPDVWLSLARASSTGELALLNMSGLDHDVGFLSYPFMDEVRVNPSNATAVQAIQTLASDLAARFDPDVGCTRSWDQTTVPNGFEVIIDNMMNLELFFFANDLSPNQTMVDMATSHANKTAANHFRSDGGTFHVVEYDETNGAVLGQFTSQGYSNSSTWSRGQSWAIYGFANMYARTNIQLYLDTARHAASYWLAHTPASGIIPWDFDAPSGPEVADTSAAMVAANGFLLLADQEAKVGNSSGKQLYEDAAVGLLNVHATQFWKEDWASLFSNGTVNNPAGNNLTGIVYGDYFFIRAGNELVKRNLTTC